MSWLLTPDGRACEVRDVRTCIHEFFVCYRIHESMKPSGAQCWECRAHDLPVTVRSACHEAHALPPPLLGHLRTSWDGKFAIPAALQLPSLSAYLPYIQYQLQTSPENVVHRRLQHSGQPTANFDPSDEITPHLLTSQRRGTPRSNEITDLTTVRPCVHSGLSPPYGPCLERTDIGAVRECQERPRSPECRSQSSTRLTAANVHANVCLTSTEFLAFALPSV